MTETQQHLINIIAHQLFGQNYDFLRGANWKSILNEAEQQAVFPFVYSFFREHFPDESVTEEYQKYKKIFLSHCASAIRNLYDHNELHRLLYSNSIQYVILKGQASAMYYPEPVLRSAGDVDFLIHKEDIKSVDAILSQAGFMKTAEAEKHEYHWAYQRHNTTLEMHWEFPGIPEDDSKIKEYALSVFNDATLCEDQNNEYIIPSVFHHGLVLVLHSVCHLTGTGIGLRHLLDWIVFENSFEEEKFLELFEKPLKEIGLWRYSQIMTQIGVLNFGCRQRNWCKDVSEDLCTAILNDIIRGGNFGVKDGTRKLQAKLMSNYSTKKVEDGNMLQNLIANVNTRAERNIPLVKRYPILLPVGWINVGFEYLKWVYSNKGRGIDKKLISDAEKRQKIYSELKLFEGN